MTAKEKAGLNMARIALKTIQEMLGAGMGREDIEKTVNHNIRTLDALIVGCDADVN